MEEGGVCERFNKAVLDLQARTRSAIGLLGNQEG